MSKIAHWKVYNDSNLATSGSDVEQESLEQIPSGLGGSRSMSTTGVANSNTPGVFWRGTAYRRRRFGDGFEQLALARRKSKLRQLAGFLSFGGHATSMTRMDGGLYPTTDPSEWSRIDLKS